jgi:glycosyltransferase involved in cell wall biosynthesis
MVQISIIGNIFGTDGYANHTKGLANALFKFTKTRLSTQLFPGFEAHINDEELKMLKENSIEDEINLIISTPNTWRLFTNKKRNWGYCVWEGDKVPIGWIEEFENPDIEYIIVPSEHTKQAIINTLTIGLHEDIINKIKVIPHGQTDFKPLEVEREKKFTFLCNKGFRNLEDRGGIQYAVKAYLEEFNDEEVLLILKINPAYGIVNIDELLEKIKPQKEKYPKIKIITESLTKEGLNILYNQCDVFLSPTRAESFNIPCIEAMSCGKPVITTNFGGQTDFCTNETGWIIGGELKEVKHELAYEGIKWLTPSITELRKAMREAYTSNLEAKKKECLKVASKYTWEATAEKIKDLIGGLEN